MSKIVVKIYDVSIFSHFLTLCKYLGSRKTYLYCTRGSKLLFGGSFMKIDWEMASENKLNMRQLYCNYAWSSGFYTLVTRCHTCTAVTLKYTEASSLTVLRHSLIEVAVSSNFKQPIVLMANCWLIQSKSARIRSDFWLRSFNEVEGTIRLKVEQTIMNVINIYSNKHRKSVTYFGKIPKTLTGISWWPFGHLWRGYDALKILSPAFWEVSGRINVLYV